MNISPVSYHLPNKPKIEVEDTCDDNAVLSRVEDDDDYMPSAPATTTMRKVTNNPFLSAFKGSFAAH